MKRILALCLVLSTLLGGMLLAPTSALGAGTEEDFAFLKAVGILDPAFSSDTAYVTRREAAMLLVHAANAHVTAPEKRFSDVEVGDAYAAEIAMAHDMGLISGYGDGTFHPKQSVTYNQMVKMLVVLLGYKDHAEALGGYPAGYQIIANQKDVSRGVAAKGEDPLGYADMARLMRSALLAPLAEGETYVNGFVKYAETNANILSAWHGIDYMDGEVTADYLITVSADKEVRQDEVAVNGKVVKVGKTNAASLVLQRVEAFVDRESETILYIEPHASGKVTVIHAADVVKADTGKIVYEDGENEKTETIGGAVLIKNGVVYDSFAAADLAFEKGEIKLIFRGGAVKYILAEAYVNKIVDYADENGKMVYFRDGTKLKVDPASTSVKTMFLEASGFPSGLEYCYPWDIFSVMDSGKVLKIIRSEKLVQGTVEETSDDSITVDGVSFKLSPGYRSDKTLTQPVLGMQADFYLDYTGSLAAIDTSFSKSGKYGVLVGVHAKTGLATQAQCKLYTEDGEMRGFEFAEYVRMNDETKKEADLLSAGSLIFDGTKVIRQLVTYKLNSHGEISEINTARDLTLTPDSEERLSCFSKDVYIDGDRKANGEALTYNYEDSESFGRKYLARPQTKIFVLPPEGSPDEDYKMTVYTSLPGGSENTALTYVTLFDVDTYYHIGAMTWEKKSTATGPSHPNSRMFVTKTYAGLDEAGYGAYYIEGITDKGATVKLQVEEEMEAFFGKAFTQSALDNPANFEDPETATDWPTVTQSNGYVIPTKGLMFDGNKYKVPASEVRPGDMIGYLDVNGNATLINIVARSLYAPETELRYDGYHDNVSYVDKWGNYNFGDSLHGQGNCYVVSCGRVTDRIADSFVMTTKGRLNRKGEELIRAYRSGKQCVLFDTEKGTTEKISFSDMRIGDKVMVWNRTSDIVFVAVIR